MLTVILIFAGVVIVVVALMTFNTVKKGRPEIRHSANLDQQTGAAGRATGRGDN